LVAEAVWIGLEGQVAFHDQDPLAGVANAVDFDGQSEAVEQLGAQVAFLWIHCAHQDKAGGV